MISRALPLGFVNARLLAAGILSLNWMAWTAPPLSLEGYLDETLPEAPAQSVDHYAPNDPCYVCHGNLRDDRLVQVHGASEVGCIDCHGQSDNHRNDEDNIIPPDKMFAGEMIDQLCGECHESHDVPPRKVVERLRSRNLLTAKPADLSCTACHFNHRLPHRTVRWDRRTGKVLSREALDAANAAQKQSAPRP